MSTNLDKIDRNILNHLQTDASSTVDEVAEHVHLSRNACWRRIKQLEEQGYVKKRVALLDATKLDLGLGVFVSVKALEHNMDWLKTFRDAVSGFPQIVGAYRMSGDLDYLLSVRVKDVAAYDAFYKQLISKLPNASISASFVMEEIKETTELPL
ncbi:MAG: Lrp/AsnC family transcriptional regulator [Alphaproteobacteria bacterium]